MLRFAFRLLMMIMVLFMSTAFCCHERECTHLYTTDISAHIGQCESHSPSSETQIVSRQSCYTPYGLLTTPVSVPHSSIVRLGKNNVSNSQFWNNKLSLLSDIIHRVMNEWESTMTHSFQAASHPICTYPCEYYIFALRKILI